MLGDRIRLPISEILNISTIRATLLAALCVLVGTGAAFVHAMMAASTPGDGTTVAAGVAEIDLELSRPVRLPLVNITRDSDSKAVALSAELPKTFARAAKVAIEPLSDGSYKVSWTGVAADGHVINGGFTFMVGGAASPKPWRPRMRFSFAFVCSSTSGRSRPLEASFYSQLSDANGSRPA